MNHDTASTRGHGRTKRPTILPVAWLAAATLLGVITWQVLHAGGSLDWDVFFGDAIQALRSDVLTGVMRAAHALQGRLIAGLILAFLLVYAVRRQWGPLLLLLAAVPGGMLLNLGVKLLVHRPRPLLLADVGSHGYAFPSGHALAITLLGAYLVFETFRRTPKRLWRLAASITAAAVVGVVALSRVYLGVHQPSDVAAAILLGGLWMALCLWVAGRLDDRHAATVLEPGGVSVAALPAGSSTTR